MNCIYCAPLEKDQFFCREEVLTYEEIARTVDLFVKAGIRKLRLTGGEPLIKNDILDLVRMLKEIKGLEEITMTTNGVMLRDAATDLRKAGLDRINISLDTLRRKRFRQITGSDCFEDVWEGIEKSLENNFDPVKLNVILMKGINDDEIFDFAQLTFKYDVVVRFIEFFPTNRRSQELSGCLIRNAQVKKEIIQRFGEFKEISGIKGSGPARYCKIEGSKGCIGFISNASDDFCASCSRIRIDCAGRISPCLFSGCVYDLRPLLRNGGSESSLLEYIKNTIDSKYNYNKKKINGICGIEMSSVGG